MLKVVGSQDQPGELLEVSMGPAARSAAAAWLISYRPRAGKAAGSQGPCGGPWPGGSQSGSLTLLLLGQAAEGQHEGHEQDAGRLGVHGVLLLALQPGMGARPRLGFYAFMRHPLFAEGVR